MSRILTTILILAAIAPLTRTDAHAEEGDIRLRGLALELIDGIDRLELRHEERVLGELHLPTGQLRGDTTVTAREFSYGIIVDDAFRSLGSVTLPADGLEFILVLAPTDDREGYLAFAVRADDPDFRGDDTHVLNFTPHRLQITLGDVKKEAGPGESVRLRPEISEEATTYRAMFAYEKEDAFIPFSNTVWQVNPNTKALVLVFQEPLTGRMMYRSITVTAQNRP